MTTETLVRPVFYREVTELAPTEETTMDDAKLSMSRMVFQVAMYLEKLEGVGKIDGNGYHAAQKLAEAAAQEVEDRWTEKEN